MVRQFADRYAFLRELVQNGIDAGATRLDVRFERRDDGAVLTSVDDDGCGMSRATIEGPLVTLFSSSKENDKTKIGKYGIGFVSVFATEPDVVEVTTWRDGEAWLVRFFLDHTFELATLPSRPGHGSVVTLTHTMDLAAFTRHVDLGSSALRRWCRHASVPIVLGVADSGDPAAGGAQTINVPLGLSSLVAIGATIGDERYVLGTGPATNPHEESPTFAGYYNRGLTLFETVHADDELAGITFKVDSPKLAHTISRDNIRRDEEWERIRDTVRALAKKQLRDAVVARCAQAAKAASEGSDAAAAELRSLYAAAARPFYKSAPRFEVPLVEPIDGKLTLNIQDLRARSADRIVFSDGSTATTAALARVGHPVIRAPETTVPALTAFLGDDVIRAEHAFACASIGPQSATDDAWLAILLELLRKAGRQAAHVHLATFAGLGADDLHRVPDAPPSPTVVTAAKDIAERAWGRGSTLLVNAEASTTRLARKRASEDPALAAHLFCRILLLQEGPIAASTVDALLELGPGAAAR